MYQLFSLPHRASHAGGLPVEAAVAMAQGPSVSATLREGSGEHAVCEEAPCASPGAAGSRSTEGVGSSSRPRPDPLIGPVGRVIFFPVERGWHTGWLCSCVELFRKRVLK